MKIAVVCDWLVTYAGAERVVEQILKIYPEADLFCVVDFIEAGHRDFICEKKTITSFIQNLPGAKKHYKAYLPLMPLAIEQLDVSSYDLIISSSHAVAKGIITGPDQIHISYVHSPIRYAWDLQHQYLKEAGLAHGIKSWLARCMLHYMRMWDYRTANGVDYFIANSQFIARRIKKVYGREADVIYPPVDTEAYSLCKEKKDFYLTASRLVPYKKVRLIVEAFNEMPGKTLVVIGDGSEYKNIKEIAKENIILMGYQPFDILKEKMQQAKAFVFAAEEDFGIMPVEAQACGTPVIAYAKGGALETVNAFPNHAPTGVFFAEQTVDSIRNAIEVFEQSGEFSPEDCRLWSEKFQIGRFQTEFKSYIDKTLNR